MITLALRLLDEIAAALPQTVAATMGRLSAGGPLSVSFGLGNSLALTGGQGRGTAGGEDASPLCPRLCPRAAATCGIGPPAAHDRVGRKYAPHLKECEVTERGPDIQGLVPARVWGFESPLRHHRILA